MGPVRSVRNQYLGVNAHLHSALQDEGGWGNFHTRHIVHLADWLNRQVRSLGYIAVVEDSLQIRRMDESVRRPKSDITIYDVQPLRAGDRPAATQGGVGLLLPLTAAFDLPELSEKPYRAVAIYEQAGVAQQGREPVAWLEVLSPSNKRPGDDAEAYLRKRRDLLDSGIVFVELDYLHETPPTFSFLPDYSAAPREPARPYRIVVCEPRPRREDGWMRLVEFGVDEQIPTLAIPLNGPDLLSCDFDLAYQTTFEAAYLGDLVDYATLPVHFDRYSPADQARIANRILAVLAAAQAGADLEAGPLPADTLPLDEALVQLTGLGVGRIAAIE
ncbi:MAG: DUF4058 family protein [Thermomicrobiales bacterium]